MQKANIRLAAVAAVAITVVLLFSWVQSWDQEEEGITIRDIDGSWNVMYTHVVGNVAPAGDDITFEVSGQSIIAVSDDGAVRTYAIVSDYEAICGAGSQLFLDGDHLQVLYTSGGNTSKAVLTRDGGVTFPTDDSSFEPMEFDVPMTSWPTEGQAGSTYVLNISLESKWMGIVHGTMDAGDGASAFSGFAKEAGDRCLMTVSPIGQSGVVVMDLDLSDGGLAVYSLDAVPSKGSVGDAYDPSPFGEGAYTVLTQDGSAESELEYVNGMPTIDGFPVITVPSAYGAPFMAMGGGSVCLVPVSGNPSAFIRVATQGATV